MFQATERTAICNFNFNQQTLLGNLWYTNQRVGFLEFLLQNPFKFCVYPSLSIYICFFQNSQRLKKILNSQGIELAWSAHWLRWQQLGWKTRDVYQNMSGNACKKHTCATDQPTITWPHWPLELVSHAGMLGQSATTWNMQSWTLVERT